MDVLIRQAHPGPAVPPYSTLEQKAADARRHHREDGLPWPVLVDDVAGTVHQVFGGLADPTYILDRDGFVAFYNMWTHAPTLHRALEELKRDGDQGVVRGGIDRMVHMASSMTDGWKGLRHGLWQSVTDLMAAAPGSPIPIWIGYQLRPLLAPLTLRATPLPTAAKAALALGLVGGLAVAFRRRS